MKMKVNVLKNVALMTTTALCGFWVFASCENFTADSAEKDVTGTDVTGTGTSITNDEAITIAMMYVPDGKVESSELTTDHDQAVYRIALSDDENSYVFYVNAANGQLEGLSNEAVYLLSGNVDINSFIGDEEAKNSALQLTGGGTVTLCRLTYNNGEAEYEVGVTNGTYTYLVILDAYTGDVVRFTRDSIPQTGDPGTPYNPEIPYIPPVTPNPPVTPAYPTSPQVNITAETAKSTALAKVGGGTVARVETHYAPHGVEIKVLIVYNDYRYCVHVNASTGYIMDIHSDPVTRIAPNASYYASGAISAANAKAIAIQYAGSGIVTECNLEYKPHNGSLTYHIHVANGQYEYCVELNAKTGAAIKVEPRYKP